jgi:hypothetical protein
VSESRTESLDRNTVTGHRTTAVISAKYGCPEAVPPPEVHFFLSYEDWTTSYWSYEDEYKLIDERDAIAEPAASLGASSQYVNRALFWLRGGGKG